jgi:predicted RNase H-like HicB family nuclease
VYDVAMSELTVDIEQETDGRWIGEVPDLPGVMVYGESRDEAVAKAKALAFRVLADRLEHGEDIPEIRGVFAVHGWAEWDRQIEQDSRTGRLDKLFAKARADHAAGKSTKLDPPA